MSVEVTRSAPPAAPVPTTLTELVDRCFERYRRPCHYLLKRDGAWQAVSTATARESMRRLAGALAKASIGRGDRVAIVAKTSYEWVLADYAILSLGAVVVPIYATLTPAQTQHILAHSGARLAFVGDREQFLKLDGIRASLPRLERVISMTPIAEPGAPPDLQGFLKESGPFSERAPRPDDLASIIYTSGTTGEPKGVMLTHRNIVSNVIACTRVCPFDSSDLHLSFLPLSHIFERMVHYYMLWNGVTIAFAEDMATVRDDLREVRPTILTTVPRLLEKIMASVEERGRAPGIAGAIARFAVVASREFAAQRWGREGAASPLTVVKHRLADWLALGRIRDVMGGRVRVIVTGGAATPTVVTEFFRGLGIDVLPGYGLTESSPVIAFNTPAHFRYGTVGRAIPGVEVRVAPDGELVVRGDNVMKGYFQNPEATAEAIQDGWLRTGDVGQVDQDGFVAITDRKKDLLVTAGGKNVAPQPIEQRLGQDPFIAQAMLVGDGRPYIAALIVPRWSAVKAWAVEKRLDCAVAGDLLGRQEVVDLIRERIELACADRASFERIKRFALLLEEFSDAAGELTPTLKIKRRVVAARHAALIESLYA